MTLEQFKVRLYVIEKNAYVAKDHVFEALDEAKAFAESAACHAYHIYDSLHAAIAHGWGKPDAAPDVKEEVKPTPAPKSKKAAKEEKPADPVVEEKPAEVLVPPVETPVEQPAPEVPAEEKPAEPVAEEKPADPVVEEKPAEETPAA